jgi:hypothetical protein
MGNIPFHELHYSIDGRSEPGMTYFGIDSYAFDFYADRDPFAYESYSSPRVAIDEPAVSAESATAFRGEAAAEKKDENSACKSNDS